MWHLHLSLRMTDIYLPPGQMAAVERQNLQPREWLLQRCRRGKYIAAEVQACQPGELCQQPCHLPPAGDQVVRQIKVSQARHQRRQLAFLALDMAFSFFLNKCLA